MRKLLSTAIVFGLTAMLAGCPGGGKTGAKTGDKKTGAKTGAAKTGAAKTGDAKDGGDKGGDDTGQLTDHLKKGQKFTFEQTMDQPTMSIKTTEVYTVKDIKPGDAIYYDVERTTETKMKNPPAGMPPMKPQVQKQEGQKFPLKAPEVKGDAKKTDAPKPVGEEDISVGGITFHCKIYENNGTKTWIDARRWPTVIKMDGKIKKTLVKVE